ncbi:MAG: antitoxin VbhA family protein [Ostreibacterium sp.]
MNTLTTAATKLDTSEEAIAKRRHIVANAEANDLLENMPPLKKGSYAWEVQEQWINGEITSKEQIQLVEKYYKFK